MFAAAIHSATNTGLREVNRAVMLLALCLAAAAPTALAAYTPSEAKIEGRTMGTTYHATFEYNSAAFTEQEIQSAIDARLAEINSGMSTYDPESELSRFNALRSTDWFAVSEETATVVQASLDVARRTKGAFDPTVGPLVNLWGFGPDKRRTKPPSEAEIRAAQTSVGYQAVTARLDPPALRKSNPDVYLDLSAIAKGYAADAIAELLASDAPQGFRSRYAMVEIGGEIRTHGTRPDGRAWRIGIERPDADARLISKVVELSHDDALATSGDYRNYFEADGKRYSHTINPTTGRPVDHQLATVTVRARTSMEADALATSLLVMGPEDGLSWANREGVAALMIERTADGFREQQSLAWSAIEGSKSAGDSTVDFQANKGNNMGSYILISAIVFAIALAGMAIGVILSNRRIKGTCGGLAGLQDRTGKTACEICSNPSPTCSGNPERKAEPVEHR